MKSKKFHYIREKHFFSQSRIFKNSKIKKMFSDLPTLTHCSRVIQKRIVSQGRGVSQVSLVKVTKSTVERAGQTRRKARLLGLQTGRARLLFAAKTQRKRASAPPVYYPAQLRLFLLFFLLSPPSPLPPSQVVQVFSSQTRVPVRINFFLRSSWSIFKISSVFCEVFRRGMLLKI